MIVDLLKQLRGHYMTKEEIWQGFIEGWLSAQDVLDENEKNEKDESH